MKNPTLLSQLSLKNRGFITSSLARQIFTSSSESLLQTHCHCWGNWDKNHFFQDRQETSADLRTRCSSKAHGIA